MAAIIVQMKKEDPINNKIVVAAIQADNGQSKAKWKNLREYVNELQYKYKFPKIIHIDVNANNNNNEE